MPKIVRKFRKQDWIIVAVLTAVAAALRFVRLHLPAEIVFDETYFANFAHNYLTGTKFFDAEPPLGKFIIAGGEQLFGFNSLGWRVMPALFGTAIIPLMYLLAKRLFGGVVIPTAAALLALFDGMLLVESRTALLDGFVVFFNLLTYTLFLLSLQAGTKRRSIWWLLATGVSFGLGLSLKWITLAFIAPAVGLLILLVVSHRRRVQRLFKVASQTALFEAVGARPANVHNPLVYLGGLVALPVAIYLALFSLHVPFDSTGGNIWEIHRQIYNYHHTLQASHPYGSPWYTWPLTIRPVAIYFNTTVGQWAGIVALGNPLIWWAGLVGVGFAAYRFWKTRNLVLLLILAGLAAHFLPWALIGRVLFAYHYLGGLPFVMLALAYALGQLWWWRPKGTGIMMAGWTLLLAGGGLLGGLLGRSVFGGAPATVGFSCGALIIFLSLMALMMVDVRGLRWGQKQAIAILALIGLAFVFFFPIWTGIPLDSADYYRHMWLKSWI